MFHDRIKPALRVRYNLIIVLMRVKDDVFLQTLSSLSFRRIPVSTNKYSFITLNYKR